MRSMTNQPLHGAAGQDSRSADKGEDPPEPGGLKLR
jgi:hypothetical protein